MKIKQVKRGLFELTGTDTEDHIEQMDVADPIYLLDNGLSQKSCTECGISFINENNLQKEAWKRCESCSDWFCSFCTLKIENLLRYEPGDFICVNC